MARGYSDFGLNPGNYGQFSGDNAELAARLLSPVVFERRGRVLWFDDMAQGLSKYLVIINGTGTVKVKIDAGFLNGAAIEIKPDAGTAGDPKLLFTLPIIATTKVGVEFLLRWVSNNAANCTTFDLRLYYFDGAVQHEFRYNLRPDIQSIGLLSTTPVPGGTFYPVVTSYPFYGSGTEVGTSYFKTVINLQDLTYDRIVFNLTGASLRQYTSTPTPAIARPRLDVLFRANPNAALNGVYISDIICTIDEP
jgi:hypothetical protein